MKRYLIVLFAAALLVVSSGCTSNRRLIGDRLRAVEGNEKFTVVLIGNSFYETQWRAMTDSHIRQFLKRELSTFIDADISVINSSRAEDAVSDIMRRIQPDVLSFRPSIVLLMIGQFDSNRAGLTEETYREQVKNLFAYCVEHDLFPIVLTPVAYRDAVQMRNELVERLKMFNEITMFEAGHHGFPVIDTFAYVDHLRETNPEEYRSLFKDQIVFSDKGCDYVLSYVVKKMRASYKKHK